MRAVLGFVVASMFVAPVVDAAGLNDQWHFEALSLDGKHALLRRLDAEMRSGFDVRVVDVDARTVIEETNLPELARVPASTIGGKPTEIAALEWMLASPAFGRDLVRGAAVASAFPFGACGRLAAGPTAISFDAGDWLYVADKDGRVRRRLFDEAAYDPRFSPDGKWLFFRRATGHERVLARYEMFVSPSDLSAPPRPIPGTAGMHDRFVIHPDGKTAFAISAQPGGAETCVVSLGLRPPFATKKLACIEGQDERVVESAISPKGKWAALSTHVRGDAHWHLRVLSLATATATPTPTTTATTTATATPIATATPTPKVVRNDMLEEPGRVLRAISDAGLAVESGPRGGVVVDAQTGGVRALPALDLGHRAFFRSDTELVYATSSGNVSTLDVSDTSK